MEWENGSILRRYWGDAVIQSYLNIDCMDPQFGLPSFPDNYFDLAIVDPPYGMERKMDGTGGAGRIMRKWKRNGLWDVKPKDNYFIQLFRISKNQIIWGANNFIENLISTTNYVFWYKHQPAPNFADGELAWTSFKGVCKCFDYRCFGAHGQDSGGKIHPTQKPVALYRWLLNNYAKPGDLILDTHVGSASSLIAFEEQGFSYIGYELDPDYYRESKERVNNARKQQKLFSPNEIRNTMVQGDLFEQSK